MYFALMDTPAEPPKKTPGRPAKFGVSAKVKNLTCRPTSETIAALETIVAARGSSTHQAIREAIRFYADHLAQAAEKPTPLP